MSRCVLCFAGTLRETKKSHRARGKTKKIEMKGLVYRCGLRRTPLRRARRADLTGYYDSSDSANNGARAGGSVIKFPLHAGNGAVCDKI